MKITDWVSVKTVIEDFLDTSGEDSRNVNTRVIKKWAHDALEMFFTADIFQYAIMVTKIENYGAAMPKGFKSVVQVGFQPRPNKAYLREVPYEYVQKLYGDDCELKITVECPECHSTDACSCSSPSIIVDVDRLYESSRPEWYTRYFKHFYDYTNLNDRPTSSIDPNFTLIGPSQQTIRHTQYHIPGCVNLNVDSDYYYDIQGNKIIVNCESGHLLMAYLREPIDDEGYRRVPNSIYAFEAINRYIEEKLAYKYARKTRNPQDRVFHQTTYQLREEAIRKAHNHFSSISTDDFWNFLNNHVRKTAPYYNWKSQLDRNKKDAYRKPRH